MRFIENKKLAARIGVITTAITLAGMTLLWLVVSTNAASMVKNDITNQMTLLVENGIREISAVVQDNSVAAEKSASVSKELSQQAQTLNSLISRFHI